MTDLKRAVAPEGLTTNSWTDVWALTRGDTDSFLEAEPDDLFAVHLENHAFAGYTWSLVEAGAHAEIVGELQAAHSDRVDGKPSARVVIDDHGRERGGLPRRAKLDALACGA